MENSDEVMWGRKELAAFLGLSEHTIRTYVTSHPDRLPPRLPGFRRSRWVRSVVEEWVRDRSKEAGEEAAQAAEVAKQAKGKKNGVAAPVAAPGAAPAPAKAKARRGRPRLPPP